MRLKKLKHGAYQVVFNNTVEMNSTLMRFAEHYESPKFRNKVFSRAEFKAWYAKTYGGQARKFTYFYDWAGFNIPDYIFEAFNSGKFDPLTRKEKQFLKLINKIKAKKFYIVVTSSNSSKYIFRHEVAHAMYYLLPMYRWKSRLIISMLATDIFKFFKYLKKSKYSWRVYLDETQAYLLENPNYFIKEVKMNSWTTKLVNRKLNDNYGRYFG